MVKRALAGPFCWHVGSEIHELPDSIRDHFTDGGELRRFLSQDVDDTLAVPCR